jgi:Cys-rich protein (TIGR01571 family)
MQLPPTTAGDSSSVGGSTITAGSVAEAHLSTTEALARQQLMAELREASNLMAESVTPEAATFWRNHVVDLQARLRALHGEGGDDINFAAAEANRQLLEQYHNTTERPKYAVVSPKTEPIYQPQVHEASSYQPPADRAVTAVVEPPAPKRQVVSITPQSAGRSARPMVDVIAPADLPGGYHFEAEIQGRRFLATVPAGGVQKGNTFSCVMRDLETVGVGTPVGRWRDRLCDCGIYGLCHALICMTIFCPLLALSQVMTRLNYDFLGRASDVKRVRTAWSTMWSILFFHVAMNGLIYTAYCYKWSENIPLSSADIAAVVLFNVSFVLYAIYTTSSARASLREKYMIREHRFFDLEDCCCATFCMPCTICQMSRHTANYDNVDAVCCSATGLRQKSRPVHSAPARGAAIELV